MDQTTEAGRTISAATASQLDKATTAMKDAMSTIMKLLGIGNAPASGPPVAPPGVPQQNAAIITSKIDDASITERQRATMEAALSFGDIGNVLRAALQSENANNYYWVKALYPDHVIYSVEPRGTNEIGPSTLYQRPYVIDSKNAVTFGDAVKVVAVTSYETVESATVEYYEATFTPQQRDALAGKGHAMPDGSYPITNGKDLMNAISASGRAKDPAAVRKHIIARAKAMKLTNMLPTAWQEAADASGDNLAEVELVPDVVPLAEADNAKSGTTRLKLIDPGWGSTGYYGADVLKRDGPKVFAKGTHMYLDHPTESEAEDRPERSVKDLAAVLTSDARWDANGPTGPGLYAEAEIDPQYRSKLKWLAPHIGVSIRGSGRVSEGEAEGRAGVIIDELVNARSVDFVTLPGRGGQVLEVFESARGAHHSEEASVPDPTALEEAQKKIDEQATLLASMSEQVERLRTRDILRDARDMVDEALRESDLPAFAQKRVRASLLDNPPIEEGALQRDGYAETITATIDEWSSDLSEIAAPGIIRGVGITSVNEDDSEQALVKMFVESGYTQEVAEQMARA